MLRAHDPTTAMMTKLAGQGMLQVMNDEALTDRLAELRVEHRQLDEAIESLRRSPPCNQLEIARLKKRKLRLKDEIALLADQMIPDIIA